MEKLDIRRLIDEATEYDKKQALDVKKSKSWCKSVSAFADGVGVKLVCEVADDDTLVGLADIFSRLRYMERRGSGFKKFVSAYKGHDGYTEGMDPTFSTPWDCFVLTLPKFNVDGVDGVYIISDDVIEHGGQKGGQKDADKTIDTILQLIKDNPSITRKTLTETVGISQSAIQKHINRLKAEGIVIVWRSVLFL